MKPTRLFETIYHQLKTSPQEKAIGWKEEDTWKFLSTQEIVDAAEKTACGLLKLGLTAGDKIAIVSYKNRPEWVIMDLASQMAKIISVPLYPTISSGEYEYILNDSEVKYAFVGKDDLFDKLKEAQSNVPSLINIYTFDQQDNRPFWQDIWTDDGKDQLDEIKNNVKTEDVATIIYTSGTTGNPKGVVLTHENICHVAYASKEIIPMFEGKKVLSFLPLCHIFERTAIYTFILNNGSVHFTGTDNLGGENGDLKQVKPTFFTCVPRLLEKVYEAIYNKGLELTGIKKKLFFWALDLTKDYEYDKKYQGVAAFKLSIADKLIFSKWREALGGNVEGIVTGAAPLPEKIAQVFSAAGIPIREGYGLTEASPVISANRFEEHKALLGTVGTLLDGVDVLIDDSDNLYQPGEGEILAKGPNIMVGYYNKPDKTMEVFKEINGEKYLKTGDIGMLIDGPGGNKFLKITDRKKELLKTSGGKYVAPAPIENRLKEDFFVEQVMVIGDKRKFVSALIIPAEETLKDWCKNNQIPWTHLNEIIENPKVIELFESIIEKYNPEFSHIEKIKKFKLIGTSWDAQKTDGSEAELTPTLKLKRRVINEKYKDQIDQIYA